MLTTIMEKLKMNKPELIDPETIDSEIRTALASLPAPANCYFVEMVNALGIDLDHLLRWGLQRVLRERREKWKLTRRLPHEARFDGVADPQIMRPLDPLPMPKPVDELVKIARRAAKASRPRGHLGSPPTPVTEIEPTFWQQVGQHCRLFDPFKAKWFRERMGMIVSGGAVELGEPPTRPEPMDTGRAVDAGIEANREIRRNAKIHCRACGFGGATLAGGCPNCGESVTRPVVVAVPATA
jgi:hypothetical protein